MEIYLVPFSDQPLLPLLAETTAENVITLSPFSRTKPGNFPLYQNFLIDRPFYTLRLLQFRIFALEFGLLPPFLTALQHGNRNAPTDKPCTSSSSSSSQVPFNFTASVNFRHEVFSLSWFSRSQWIICRIISRMKGAKIHGKTSFKKWRYAFRHKGRPLCWKDKEH